MAGSVNKVILIGNLGRDPESRQMQSGDKMVNLSVATSESWKDRQTGERKEKTEWHRVVVFNPHLAEIAEKYLRKGSKIYVEGQLVTRKWQDQSGQDKYSTEVVLNRFKGELTMLDGRNDGGGGGGGYDSGPSGGDQQGGGGFDSGPSGGGDQQGGGGWDNSGGGGAGGGAGGGGGGNIDDEIPF